MGESIFVYFEDYSQSLLPQRKNKIWILKKHVVFFHRFESERERVREREKGYRCLSIIFAINTHQCVVFFVWAIGSKIVTSTWKEKLRTSWQFYSKRVFFALSAIFIHVIVRMLFFFSSLRLISIRVLLLAAFSFFFFFFCMLRM